MDRQHYNGTVAYARAKRAQVVLNREWARRVAPDQVVFQAMHPAGSIPRYRLIAPDLLPPDAATVADTRARRRHGGVASVRS